MIAQLSRGRDFAGLQKYLTENRDHALVQLRGVSSAEHAASEMEAVAALSRRATAPVMHVSFSLSHEDGQRDDAFWLRVADRADREFQLEGCQRIVVRHYDTEHDHIHIYWCTISPDTGRTPPKQEFLTKGSAVEGIGPLALTKEQIACIPETDRKRRSFDSFALTRLQRLSRHIEHDEGLRRLRLPHESAVARVAGEERRSRESMARRQERTGATGLMDRTAELRAALDAPDWSAARTACARLGVGFEPSLRKSKAGPDRIIGLALFDLKDLKNRMAASQLDLPDRKYGLRQIEKRQRDGARTMDDWWPEHGADPAIVAEPPIARDVQTSLRMEYNTLLEQHRLREAEKARQLRRLKERHKRQEVALRRNLMNQRKAQASLLAADQRRDFYRTFSRTVRQSALTQLAEIQRAERTPLRRGRMPDWMEFAAQRTQRSTARVLRSATGPVFRQVEKPVIIPSGRGEPAAETRQSNNVKKGPPADRADDASDVGQPFVETIQALLDIQNLSRGR